MSVKAPPLIFGDEISSTPPSQKMPSLNSVLKLLRKLNCAVAEFIGMPTESSRLSLTTSASLINALFGAELGVVVVVTHIGAGPAAFVATQPNGSAGAVTPSKFSV